MEALGEVEKMRKEAIALELSLSKESDKNDVLRGELREASWKEEGLKHAVEAVEAEKRDKLAKIEAMRKDVSEMEEARGDARFEVENP